jgi:hypothetical protein
VCSCEWKHREELHDVRDTIGRMLKAYGVVGRQVPVIICNPVPYPTSCRYRWPIIGSYKWRNEVFAGCIGHPTISQTFRTSLLDIGQRR